MNDPVEGIDALVRERRPMSNSERRRLRLNAGLRVQEIAERVGVTEGAVRHWEVGRAQPSGEHAVKYFAILDAISAALAEDPGWA